MAPKTTWLPAPTYGRTTPQQWLFTDGTIYKHPPLEQSASGRRIRFQGETKSFGVNQTYDEIRRRVENEATSRGVNIWREIPENPEQNLLNRRGVDINTPAVVNEEGLGKGGGKALGWLFHDATTQMYASIVVEYSTSWNGTTTITTFLSYYSTLPGDGINPYHRQKIQFPINIGLGHPHYKEITDWIQGHQDDQENLPLIQWGARQHQNQRAALIDVFKTARTIDELDGVYIPDLRDPANPTWLKLDRVGTNYNQDFDRTLTDRINTGPALDELKQAVDGVLVALRKLGIVVEDLPDKAYAQAMSGDLTEFVANLQADRDEVAKDPYHKVVLNLATGTVAVGCMHDGAKQDEVATAYQNAKFMAELKGEGDEFLAYAQAFLESKAQENAQRIIASREALTQEMTEFVGQSTTGGK